MGRLTVADAKRMCTKAELGVVMGSRPDAIEKLSVDQLKKNVASARRLRDKWQDLATEQRRETQQAQKSRVTDKNARSGEKAALFAHVLKRYEEQLAKAQAGGSTVGKVLPKPPKKKVRAAGHRLKRAVARDELKDVRSELNAASKAKVKKKKAAKKKGAATPAAAPKKKVAKKKAAPKKVAKKKVAKKAAKKKPAFGVGSLGLVTAEPARQLSAQTAAKKSRLKASGKTSRVQAHVQARGGRKQAKRDSR
ncbi:hypothetical protein [Lacipirellula sp.]|uniref:hypothetical protein n=1 Tax=Lacipirellula sp. TaxID=2691419 RepID=UPI003D0DC2FA